ncbi:ABC transporter permease [Halofilum ochraceum]|uniref:ABC transporter permease n=1 Tax=Halofilum ochraceum TaxID=1611323 RepID=UPI00082EFBF3|nr:ABC transporter permease [Halofilum ochraceum]
MAEPRGERPGQSGQGAARRTAPAKAGPSASRWRSLGPAVPGLLFLAIVFLLPVFGVFLRGVTDPVFGLQNYAELLGSGTFYDILGNTFLVAILVTIFSILLGFPVAWLITIAPGRIAKLVLAVVLLSMWTSLLARTYAWLVLLQNSGIINKMLVGSGLIDQPIALVNNLTGIVIGMTYIMIPFIVLPLQTSMAAIDKTVLQAASVCGARAPVVFTRVFLPLVTPGLTAGGTMVFVMSLGYYVTPALLGSTKNMMLAEYIVQQVLNYLEWGIGGAAAVILLVITLAIYLPVLGFQRNTAST